MSKVALVAGYGPGISSAFAKKFGSAGFNLALLSRTQAKVDAAATGVVHADHLLTLPHHAAAVVCDLSAWL